MTDHYEALGLPKDADAATIKRAYRKRARETHPDHGGDAETFAKVSTANIVLSDPVKREKYDRTGDDSSEPDNRQAFVVSALVQAFQEAIAKALSGFGGLEMTNIIVATKKSINEQITGGELANTHLDEGMKRTRKVLRRLKFKGKGSDPLTHALNHNLVEGERSIAQNQEKLAILRDALALADEYDYETDQPAPAPPPPPWASGFGGMSQEEYWKNVDRLDREGAFPNRSY